MATGRNAVVLLLLGLASAAEPTTDELRRKLRPSVTELSKRMIEYGRKRDLTRARKVSSVLGPFVRALDARWKASLEQELAAALARKEAKAVVLPGLRVLYWDLFDLLDPVRAAAPSKPKVLRSRILKARADYAPLAPLVRARQGGERLHRGILKGFQALTRGVPVGRAYGVSKEWRRASAATAATVLRLVKFAMPRLHGRGAKK